MTQPNPKDDLEAVARIRDAIWSDICDRKGFDLNDLDDEVQDDIRTAWDAAILAALRPAGVGESVPFGYIPRKAYDQLAQGPKDQRWGGVSLVMPGLAMKNEDLVPLYTHPAHPDAALMERVRTVLEFYAEEKRWREYSDDEMASAFDRNTGSELGKDEGAKARALLSDLKAEAGR